MPRARRWSSEPWRHPTRGVGERARRLGDRRGAVAEQQHEAGDVAMRRRRSSSSDSPQTVKASRWTRSAGTPARRRSARTASIHGWVRRGRRPGVGGARRDIADEVGPRPLRVRVGSHDEAVRARRPGSGCVAQAALPHEAVDRVGAQGVGGGVVAHDERRLARAQSASSSIATSGATPAPAPIMSRCPPRRSSAVIVPYGPSMSTRVPARSAARRCVPSPTKRAEMTSSPSAGSWRVRRGARAFQPAPSREAPDEELSAAAFSASIRRPVMRTETPLCPSRSTALTRMPWRS